MSVITTGQLIYPVLAIHRGGIIEASADECSLTTATARELKIGWFDNITVVDSCGTAVKTIKARFICGTGPFWGYTLSLERIVKVDFTLADESTTMPLEKLRGIVLRRMRRDAGSIVHEEAWREKMRMVTAAESIRDLIAIVAPFYDRREFISALRSLKAT